MLGLHLGISPGVVAAMTLPTYIGFVSSNSTPTIPTHQVGDLIVGALQRTGATAATPDVAEGWHAWETVVFSAGSAAFVAGETLTQGGVTATIHRVDLTSGSWGGGTAAGFLTIRNRAGGSYTAATATSATGSATVAVQVGGFTSGNNSSILAWKIADSTSEAWGDWAQAGRRQAWVFRNAQIGVRNGNAASSSTTVNYPALSSMSGPAIVAAGLFCSTAQTSLNGKGPAGFTERVANAGGGNLSADSNVTYLSSYAGEAVTIDTASTTTAVVFSVRAA